MSRTETKGNCFLCGEELTKIKMKNHILKAHLAAQKGEKAMLIKVEGAYEKHYWLLLDIALNAELEDLDGFLRKIWLECCGHMSGFFPATDTWSSDEFAMDTKIKRFTPGAKLFHRYDFGSTTTLLITMLDNVTRPPQKDAVRLLARNAPPESVCVNCGKPAECFCVMCDSEYGREKAWYCEECFETHDCPDKDYAMPITNSPRLGVCGYTGELDVWTFDPARLNH
jgi:hypothetical protein